MASPSTCAYWRRCIPCFRAAGSILPCASDRPMPHARESSSDMRATDWTMKSASPSLSQRDFPLARPAHSLLKYSPRASRTLGRAHVWVQCDARLRVEVEHLLHVRLVAPAHLLLAVRQQTRLSRRHGPKRLQDHVARKILSRPRRPR
eukprot:2196747-Pleurochrysis_carterae.AAC.2